MGLMDSFFSTSKESESTTKKLFDPAARGYLKSLMGRQVDFPTRPVPSLTDTEQAGQGELAKFVAGRAFQDPGEGRYYEGFRRASKAEEEDAVGALRRRSQLGGAFYSSPSVRAEGDLRADFANNRLMQLGALYDAERARDNPLTRTAAAAQYGALPRQVDAAQQLAEYESALQELLFPYQAQAAIAQALMDIGERTTAESKYIPSSAAQLGAMIELGRKGIMGASKLGDLLSSAPTTTGTPASSGTPESLGMSWGSGGWAT